MWLDDDDDDEPVDADGEAEDVALDEPVVPPVVDGVVTDESDVAVVAVPS